MSELVWTRNRPADSMAWTWCRLPNIAEPFPTQSHWIGNADALWLDGPAITPHDAARLQAADALADEVEGWWHCIDDVARRDIKAALAAYRAAQPPAATGAADADR